MHIPYAYIASRGASLLEHSPASTRMAAPDAMHAGAAHTCIWRTQTHTHVFLTASIVRPGQHHLRTEPHAESRRSCRPVVCGASDHVHTHVQRAAHRDEAQTPASQILLLLFITAFFIHQQAAVRPVSLLRCCHAGAGQGLLEICCACFLSAH